MISQRLAVTLLILAAAESIPINVNPPSSKQSPKLRKARVTEGQGTLETAKSTSNLVSVLQDLRSAWAHQTPLLQLSRAVGIEHQLVDQQDVVLRVSKDNQSKAAASAEVAKATELLNSTRSNLESSRKEALRLADKAHEQATKLWAEAKAADEAEGAAATKAHAKTELAKKKKAKLDALAAEAQNEADFFSSGKALTEEQVQELSSNVLPVQEDLTDAQEEDTDVVALAEVSATAVTNATSVQNATGSGNVTEDITGAGNVTEKGSEAKHATEAEDASEAQTSDAAANATEAGNDAAAKDATETDDASEAQTSDEAVNATEAGNDAAAKDANEADDASEAQTSDAAANATEAGDDAAAKDAAEATNSTEAADATEDANTSEEATATEDVQDTAKNNSTDTESKDSSNGNELN